MQYFKTLQCCKLRKTFLDAPVRIEEAVILQEPYGKNVFGRIRMVSQSRENIIAVIIRLTAYNVAKEELELEESRYIFQDMVFGPGEAFGEQIALPLPRDARSLDVALEKAVLEDGSVWNASGESEVEVSDQEKIEIPDRYFRKFQEKITGRFANIKALNSYYEEGDGFWQCTCGTAVSASREECPYCGNDRDAQKEFLSREGFLGVLKAIDSELNAEKDAALSGKLEAIGDPSAGGEENNRRLAEVKKQREEETRELLDEREELSAARANLEQAKMEFADRLRKLEADRKKLEEDRMELEREKEALSYEKSQLNKAKELVAKKAAVVLRKDPDSAEETAEDTLPEEAYEGADLGLENAFSRQFDATAAWMKEETDRSGSWEAQPEDEADRAGDDEEDYDEDFAGKPGEEAGLEEDPDGEDFDEEDLDDEDFDVDDLDEEDLDDEEGKGKKNTAKGAVGVLRAILTIMFLGAAVSAGYFGFQYYQQQTELRSLYETAVEKMNAGDAEGAIEDFYNLGSYKDSAVLCNRLIEEKNQKTYDEAYDLYENGKYDEAISLWDSLGTFKNSEEMIKEAQTAQRKEEEKEEEEEEKRKKKEESADESLLLEDGGVSGTDQEVYDEAYAAYERGDYQLAIEMWDTVKDFKDSAKMIEIAAAEWLMSESDDSSQGEAAVDEEAAPLIEENLGG